VADLPDIAIPATSLRITCGNIELRLPSPRYAQAQLAATRDDEMIRYLNWNPQRTIDDALSYINDALTLWQRGISFLPSIFVIGDDQLIGATGIKRHRPHQPSRRGWHLDQHPASGTRPQSAVQGSGMHAGL